MKYLLVTFEESNSGFEYDHDVWFECKNEKEGLRKALKYMRYFWDGEGKYNSKERTLEDSGRLLKLNRWHLFEDKIELSENLLNRNKGY